MRRALVRPPENERERQLAISLARLWPHREHEAPALAGLLCACGLHFWRQLDLTGLLPWSVSDGVGQEQTEAPIHFCFWCSRVRIGSRTYLP